MARYGASILSQAAQLAGVNATTTVNGYMGYWGASATAGFRLRRLQLGVIAGASVPTSQQISVGVYRQTVAPAGTGIAAAVLGSAVRDPHPADRPDRGPDRDHRDHDRHDRPDAGGQPDRSDPLQHPVHA
jgi:hypothetical protein